MMHMIRNVHTFLTTCLRIAAFHLPHPPLALSLFSWPLSLSPLSALFPLPTRSLSPSFFPALSSLHPPLFPPRILHMCNMCLAPIFCNSWYCLQYCGSCSGKLRLQLAVVQKCFGIVPSFCRRLTWSLGFRRDMWPSA